MQHVLHSNYFYFYFSSWSLGPFPQILATMIKSPSSSSTLKYVTKLDSRLRSDLGLTLWVYPTRSQPLSPSMSRRRISFAKYMNCLALMMLSKSLISFNNVASARQNASWLFSIGSVQSCQFAFPLFRIYACGLNWSKTLRTIQECALTPNLFNMYHHVATRHRWCPRAWFIYLVASVSESMFNPVNDMPLEVLLLDCSSWTQNSGVKVGQQWWMGVSTSLSLGYNET